MGCISEPFDFADIGLDEQNNKQVGVCINVLVNTHDLELVREHGSVVCAAAGDAL